MAFTKEVQKRLEKKRAEIRDLEALLASAKAYAQALEDMLKLVPKETTTEENQEHITWLREGSALAQARDALIHLGQPTHISNLLIAMGREDTKQNRTNLVGSLGTYVRQGKIFTRPRPNVFGLVEMEIHTQDSSEDDQEEEPRLRRAS